jgi:hypothetical protein
MKLINFLEVTEFNALREKMKAKLVDYGETSEWKIFDPEGFRSELNTKGQTTVAAENLTIAKDGTLELYGEKIVVYIRDQNSFYGGGYKFHFSNCRTIEEQRKNGRYERRYVVSTRTDGKFLVQIKNERGEVVKEYDKNLKVCKNCLQHMNYKGYSNWRSSKSEIEKYFSIQECFSIYKKEPQNLVRPKHTDITAPINDYPPDWNQISRDIRNRRGCCEKCGTTESLDAHHKNGDKSDNRDENLQVLCRECHRQQYNHAFMPKRIVR